MGASGGGQRAQAPFLISCAPISSRCSSLLRALGVVLRLSGCGQGTILLCASQVAPDGKAKKMDLT